jgi:hypothetical protein
LWYCVRLRKLGFWTRAYKYKLEKSSKIIYTVLRNYVFKRVNWKSQIEFCNSGDNTMQIVSIKSFVTNEGILF